MVRLHLEQNGDLHTKEKAVLLAGGYQVGYLHFEVGQVSGVAILVVVEARELAVPSRGLLCQRGERTPRWLPCSNRIEAQAEGSGEGRPVALCFILSQGVHGAQSFVQLVLVEGRWST